MNWLMTGAISGGVAVIMGAFGAHYMEDFVDQKYLEKEPVAVTDHQIPLAWKRLDNFNTGARYQMYHALALLAVGLLAPSPTCKARQVAGWSFLLGSIIFSGSLYLLTITGVTKWGMVTPIGGLLLIVGWFALAAATCGCGKSKPNENDVNPVH